MIRIVDTFEHDWAYRFAWFPKTFYTEDRLAVTVWLEGYYWRDQDCATEDIFLNNGMFAKHCHSH